MARCPNSNVSENKDIDLAFDLHLPTLLLLTIGVNLLLGAFMWAIYNLRRKQACFVFWALSCLLFALGCAAAGAREFVNSPWLTIVLAHNLIALAPLLIVLGLRSFLNLPWYGPGSKWLIAAFFGHVVLLTVLHTTPDAPRFVTALYTAATFAFAFKLVARVSLASMVPTRILQAFFATHAGLMTAQMLVLGWSWVMGGFAGAGLILEAILTSHILLTTCTAFTFPLLAFVQSEQRLRLLVERDELTRVYNRRAFYKRVNTSFQQAVQHNLPFTVLMIDLDHFKKINDQWGHVTGDRALELVGKLLRQELREDDIIGRIGGEEFAVALPSTSAEQAQTIAIRVCRRIEEDGREIAGLALGLSASVGGSHRSAHHKEFTNVLMEADSALYIAKDKGRNTVHFMQPVLLSNHG